MRKRVLLKSPLRENRTAGSVRGTPGNWRSYRNKEDGGQRTEGRGQRTEDRGRRTEGRGQRAEGITTLSEER